jgi:hypothetical protein
MMHGQQNIKIYINRTTIKSITMNNAAVPTAWNVSYTSAQT